MIDHLDTTQMLAARPIAIPHILIVDDDPLVCERLEELVTHAGFVARSVGGGAAALAGLRKNFASIVITDLHMQRHGWTHTVPHDPR